MKQSELGEAAGMKQARISAMERIGEAKFSIETLIRLAAAFCVGIEIRFVSFSEMLAWENEYQPDHFDVTPLAGDEEFIRPATAESQREIGKGILDAIIGEDCFSNVSGLSQINESNIVTVSDSVGWLHMRDQNCKSTGVAA